MVALLHFPATPLYRDPVVGYDFSMYSLIPSPLAPLHTSCVLLLGLHPAIHLVDFKLEKACFGTDAIRAALGSGLMQRVWEQLSYQLLTGDITTRCVNTSDVRLDAERRNDEVALRKVWADAFKRKRKPKKPINSAKILPFPPPTTT